jgi:hypothetical protein
MAVQALSLLVQASLEHGVISLHYLRLTGGELH